MLVEAQVGRERSGVHAAQRPVERERLDLYLGGDLVRQADLIRLAFGQPLLAGGDVLQVLLVRAAEPEVN